MKQNYTVMFLRNSLKVSYSDAASKVSDVQYFLKLKSHAITSKLFKPKNCTKL